MTARYWAATAAALLVGLSAEAKAAPAPAPAAPPAAADFAGRIAQAKVAMMADPQGAPFYVAKGLSPAPPPSFPMGTPGTTGWNELMASDWEAAFAFYSKIFGWTKAEAHDMGPMGIYQLFAAGGPPIGGMMTKPAQVPVAHWGYYFNVDAVDAGAERITKGGGKIVNGPIEVPGGQWVVQAVDPQGAHFNLVAPKR